MNSEKEELSEANPAVEFDESTPVQKAQPSFLFPLLENFFTAYSAKFFILISLLTVLFSVLLFDVKMSTDNDDSMYIESAYNFSKDFHDFPATNAPLYPIFLSIFISLFGLHVILLKAVNIVLILLNIVFMYFAFRKRVPSIVLFAVLFTTAFNSYFLYFASHTFSEALGLALQGLFFLTAFNVYDKVSVNALLKDSLKEWLLLGLVTFLFVLTRNIALLAIPVLFLFFISDKKFLAAVYSVASFLVFMIPYEIIRRIIWGARDQYSGQSAILLLKDPYNPSKGNEDLSGFFTRLYQNSYLYISKRLFQILGFKSEDAFDVSGIVVLLCVILVLVSLFIIINHKNKYLLLTVIYLFIFSTGTFIILQTQWDQPRLVMVYVPLFLLIIFTGFYYILENQKFVLQIFLIITMLVVFAGSAFSTFIKAKENYPVLKENLAGNIYYGYTPDWVNYLQMSAWCGASLPSNSFTAVRKAPMSFIYAHGKQFYPVYNVFTMDADSVLATFQNNKVTHVIAASLRFNHKVNDGKIINTIQRLLYPVMQKYPDKLKLIKTIGETEPAYLYEIDYGNSEK